jgi:hypothetical protein
MSLLLQELDDRPRKGCIDVVSQANGIMLGDPAPAAACKSVRRSAPYAQITIGPAVRAFQLRVIALSEKRSSARTSHVAARRQIGARSSRNP